MLLDGDPTTQYLLNAKHLVVTLRLTSESISKRILGGVLAPIGFIYAPLGLSP
jgi:hypothetical protein